MTLPAARVTLLAALAIIVLPLASQTDELAMMKPKSMFEHASASAQNCAGCTKPPGGRTCCPTDLYVGCSVRGGECECSCFRVIGQSAELVADQILLGTFAASPESLAQLSKERKFQIVRNILGTNRSSAAYVVVPPASAKKQLEELGLVSERGPAWIR